MKKLSLTPIRSTVRAVQQFLNDGSNVLSLLMVVSLLVVVIALVMPLGSLFNAPAKATASNPSSPKAYVREHQEALKDQWIESRYTTTSPLLFSRQRQEELKDQWLEQRGIIGSTSVASIMRQEELKDKWLELHGR